MRQCLLTGRIFIWDGKENVCDLHYLFLVSPLTHFFTFLAVKKKS